MKNLKKELVIKSRLLEELLDSVKQKATALEGFQTRRTAKEFYDTIARVFNEINMPVGEMLFTDQYNLVELNAEKTDLVGISFKRNGISVAQYWQTENNNEIAVCAKRKYGKIELLKRIITGSEETDDRQPIFVFINGAEYRI